MPPAPFGVCCVFLFCNCYLWLCCMGLYLLGFVWSKSKQSIHLLHCLDTATERWSTPQVIWYLFYFLGWFSTDVFVREKAFACGTGDLEMQLPELLKVPDLCQQRGRGGESVWAKEVWFSLLPALPQLNSCYQWRCSWLTPLQTTRDFGATISIGLNYVLSAKCMHTYIWCQHVLSSLLPFFFVISDHSVHSIGLASN